MMDGMPVLRFADYLMRQTMTLNNSSTNNSNSSNSTASASQQSHPVFVSEPHAIQFALSPAALRYIALAETAFAILTQGHECKSLAYAGYGSDTIKKYGISPDAYVQVFTVLLSQSSFTQCSSM
jgi:carnitine O-acetyltransferase